MGWTPKRDDMPVCKTPQVVPALRAIARGHAFRRHAGSLLAAWAQVALALVVALGSIGLASVATLISVDPAPTQQATARAPAQR
jgi:hypothetical protein